jgi:hypothetical protein
MRKGDAFDLVLAVLRIQKSVTQKIKKRHRQQHDDNRNRRQKKEGCCTPRHVRPRDLLSESWLHELRAHGLRMQHLHRSP